MTRRPTAEHTPPLGGSEPEMSRRGGRVVAARDQASATLVVEAGEHKGDEVRLGAEVCFIGRSSSCQLILRRAEGVSRRHAQIEFTGSHYVVSDCGSRNGTLVNGLLVGPRFPLNDDDVLEVCDERIRFRGPSGRPEEAESAWLAAPRASTEPPVPLAAARRGESPPPLPALRRAPPSPGRRSEPPPLPPPPSTPASRRPPAAPPERTAAPDVVTAGPQAATALLDASSLRFSGGEPSPESSAESDVFGGLERSHPRPVDEEVLPASEPPRDETLAGVEPAREQPARALAPKGPSSLPAERTGVAFLGPLVGVALVACGMGALWTWVGQDEGAPAEVDVLLPVEALPAASPPTISGLNHDSPSPTAPQPVPDVASGLTEHQGPSDSAPLPPEEVRSGAPGTVAEILCVPGSEVQAGAALLRLVDDAPRSQRKLAALRREERAFREAAEAGDARAKQELASIRREMANLEGARRIYVVKAPRAGRVVAVQVSPGDTVSAGSTLLTLLPDGSAP
ncbi:MAG: FHA domain-containing protein [Myxococcota bacterium]